MFFKKILDRIENRLENVEYLVKERIKMECDHPCTSVYIRPNAFCQQAGTWCKVCGECKKELGWYLTERAYLKAKQVLMAEIMKVGKDKIKELEKPYG